MYLLIHLMNSVLAYFHSRLHSDLFFVLHPISHVFKFHLKYRNALENFQKTIFPIVLKLINIRFFSIASYIGWVCHDEAYSLCSPKYVST